MLVTGLVHPAQHSMARFYEQINQTSSHAKARDLLNSYQAMHSYSCLCILIVSVCILIAVNVFLDAATLTEVFPCFFLSCKANARVNLAKTGHGPHFPKLLCCSMYCLFCVVLCIVCVSMCTVPLPPSGNPIAVNKYISIKIIINPSCW